VYYLLEQQHPYKVSIPNGPVRFLFGDKLSVSSVINTNVQGMAAVGLKMALRALWEKYPNNIISTVHDEIVFDFADSEINDDLINDIKQTMAECMANYLQHPVATEHKLGKFWS
jgi:DNA polymerase I-like protein with 3'-5' exonuclease and polymerase domains